MKSANRIVALSGGVGGAKLALGLSQVLSNEQLTIIANTADDFTHWGLPISPDLDTVMYTLAKLNNLQQGWGLADESWACMEAMAALGGETWFRLGDKDLATHLQRLTLLQSGLSLTQVTQHLSTQLGIVSTLLPMCDEAISTIVHSSDGDLAFQRYFVERQCSPKVTGFSFSGIEHSSLSSAVSKAILTMDALVVCPSNPFVSIAPILAVNGLKQALLNKNVPRIVVSPIVSGMAIKGPAAKMMQELSIPVSVLEIAKYYQDFATLLVIDNQDAALADKIKALGMDVLVTNTLMHNLQDREQLATDILATI